MGRRGSLVSKVHDHKADADTSHGHKEKYQNLFQGAHTFGSTTHFLYSHLHPTVRPFPAIHQLITNYSQAGVNLNFDSTDEP